MKKTVITSVLITLIIITINQANAQPGLGLKLRSAIYRIEQPVNSTISLIATGILFTYKNQKFLITNRHCVNDSSKTDNICDSISIYANIIMPNGEILSTDNRYTIILRISNQNLYFLPRDPALDLILISIGKNNFHDYDTFANISKPYSLTDKVLLKWNQLLRCIDTTSIVTVIGYPSKKRFLKTSFPEYRWGEIIAYNKDIIKMNAPIIHGNSGSAVFIRHNKSYFLIGIACAIDSTSSYAIPVSKIHESFGDYFNIVDSNNMMK